MACPSPENRLRLVGQQEFNPAPGDHSLIASMFERLPKEVRQSRDLTRLIGYEAVGLHGDRLRFFGIEADGIEDLPDDLVAWDLGDHDWTIWQAQAGQLSKVSEEKIAWAWLDTPDSGRRLGEFRACGPSAPAGSRADAARDFHLFAHLYLARRRSGFRDEVSLVDYDPSWPAQFAEFATWLREAVGSEVARRIEHYGSTAIPGMPAKPILDVLVEIPSFAEARARVLPRLNDPCWEYWWYADHMVFFRRREVMGERTAHVHLAPAGHELWRGLAFRDHLRSHPVDAARYAALKRELPCSSATTARATPRPRRRS